MSPRLRFIALVMVMGLIGYGLFSIGDRVDTLGSQLEESKADRTALRAELEEQEGAAKKHLAQMEALAEQVERLGGKPVVDPANPSAAPRPLGPTDAQVLKAVEVICGAKSGCRPTEAQVKTALTTICGDCRGKDAAPPKDGTNGTNGEDAPAVTAEQIDAAVARNCGDDGCRGPGPTDQQVDDRLAVFCADGNCRGDDGRGIESVTCEQGIGRFTFAFTDGTTQTVECSPVGP